MKLKVHEWEYPVQASCFTGVKSDQFKSPEHEALWEKIEARTYGKLYQARVAIALDTWQEGVVKEAIKTINLS